MAHSLSHQFLTEDEKSFINKLFTNDAVSSSTPLFPYDDVSITELTRQMNHSSLYNNNNKKGVYENRSYAKSSSGNDTVLKQNLQRARYDLLHAAAGEDERVHRVKYDEEEEAFYGFTPKKHFGFHTQNHQHQHAISQKQLQFQIAQFEMLKKQWLKQREEFARAISQRRSGNYPNIPGGRRNTETVFQSNVDLSSSASVWSSVKNGSNSNKAGFPGNPNLRNERNGTGVFLPRVVDATESRKNSGGVGSKNVMVPERVVHALNRKFEEGMIRGYMQQKSRFYGTSNFENGVGSDYGFSQQKRNVKQQLTEVNREIRLPQEWTY